MQGNIFQAKTAEEVDEYYTRRLLGANTTQELYKAISW